MVRRAPVVSCLLCSASQSVGLACFARLRMVSAQLARARQLASRLARAVVYKARVSLGPAAHVCDLLLLCTAVAGWLTPCSLPGRMTP